LIANLMKLWEGQIVGVVRKHIMVLGGMFMLIKAIHNDLFVS